MSEQLTTMGKVIIKRFFDYYEDVGLDDEADFFPVLKVIISGVVDNCENDFQKKEIEQALVRYSKQLYVSVWMSQAEQDEEPIDADREKAEAIDRFESLYKSINDS